MARADPKADAPESFDIPPRGRHYTEIWEEEDGAPGHARLPVSQPRQTIQHFVPTEMRDEHLVNERGLGSFTERVVAAIVGTFGFRQGKDEGHHEVSSVDVVDLEDGMKKELRSVMLLGEHDEVGLDMTPKLTPV